MKKWWILYILLFLIISLFFTRLINPREIDDVHPLIPCEQEYLEKSDTLWVVPKFKNYSIAENKTWCNKILSLNKTIGIHGYTHTYKEFEKETINQNEIDESIKIFQDCFGFAPLLFKPPQLELNKENRKILEKNNFIIKQWFNQGIHKIYHCDDDSGTNEFGGVLPNTFHDLF